MTYRIRGLERAPLLDMPAMAYVHARNAAPAVSPRGPTNIGMARHDR